MAKVEARKIWLSPKVYIFMGKPKTVYLVQNNFGRDMNYGHCGGKGMGLMHAEKLAQDYARSTHARYLGVQKG